MNTPPAAVCAACGAAPRVVSDPETDLPSASAPPGVMRKDRSATATPCPVLDPGEAPASKRTPLSDGGRRGRSLCARAPFPSPPGISARPGRTQPPRSHYLSRPNQQAIGFVRRCRLGHFLFERLPRCELKLSPILPNQSLLRARGGVQGAHLAHRWCARLITLTSRGIPTSYGVVRNCCGSPALLWNNCNASTRREVSPAPSRQDIHRLCHKLPIVPSLLEFSVRTRHLGYRSSVHSSFIPSCPCRRIAI